MEDYRIETLESEVRETVAELFWEDPGQVYPEDMATEVADGAVPIYTSDLFRYAAENQEVAYGENPFGETDGTPVEQITAVIYGILSTSAGCEVYACQETVETWEALDHGERRNALQDTGMPFMEAHKMAYDEFPPALLHGEI